MEPILVGLISTIVGLWLGSVEWRLRNMDTRMRNAPSREEVEKQIDLKNEALRVMQKEIKEDVRDINKKLDALINAQLNDRNHNNNN